MNSTKGIMVNSMR